MISTKEQIFTTLGEPDSVEAIISVDKFIAWRNSKTFDEFLQIEYRGALKSKDIASQIQEEQNTKFSKSALTQNIWVRHLREELEQHLRDNNVLPELTKEAEKELSKGSKENPKLHDANIRKSLLDSKRLAELQETVLQLKARIQELEQQLHNRSTKENIYAELAAMGADFGR